MKLYRWPEEIRHKSSIPQKRECKDCGCEIAAANGSLGGSEEDFRCDRCWEIFQQKE